MTKTAVGAPEPEENDAWQAYYDEFARRYKEQYEAAMQQVRTGMENARRLR